VESAIVSIVRHADRPPPHPWLFRLVAAGFGQRRKMLRRSLAGLVSADQMAAAGIRPDGRAEELDLEAWTRLAACTRPPPS
jgi:16S rRNA (adenine1518-N6/adenine1519-N6)-dimethyltransferase